MHLVDAHAIAQGPRNGKYAQRGCILELVPQIAELVCVRIQPVHADVEHAQRFLDHLRKSAPDGHDLTDAFHLASNSRRRALELGKIPAWHLTHKIVESRLEKRGRAPCDVVWHFEQ